MNRADSSTSLSSLVHWESEGKNQGLPEVVVVPANGTRDVKLSDDTAGLSVSSSESAPVYPEGKHLARRPVGTWGDYGDPSLWSKLFEESVLYAVGQIRNKEWTTPCEMTEYFEARAREIAKKRKNKSSHLFGTRRDSMHNMDSFVEFMKYILSSKVKNCYTCIRRDSNYGYALERALSIPYGHHFINKCDKAGIQFMSNLGFSKREFAYGLVQGSCRGETIPLTQYIASVPHQQQGLGNIFGYLEGQYLLHEGYLKSVVCVHTDNTLISKCMEHINDLINQALEGDLTVIPNIHWWYVHTAPTYRGSGGIAEMIVNTLCRLQGIDLPAWDKGVAPAVEALLEPDENRYAENFHQLFAGNNEELKEKFQKPVVYPEGKHLARRPVGTWGDYGDPTLWSELFEASVLHAVGQIRNKEWTTPCEMTEYFEARAGEIAKKRENPDSHLFGARRDLADLFQKCLNRDLPPVPGGKSYYTPIDGNGPFGYAFEKALSIPDDDHFIDKCGKAGDELISHLDLSRHLFTCRLVQGLYRGETIPLTQYIFSVNVRKAETEQFFGCSDQAYIVYEGEWKSALWVHTSHTLIPKCMEHIHGLINQALKGDLSVIPNIHWWYVHTTPTYRGSGGIAEMIVNTLCRLQGIDLPAWAKGVAPAVEALLEPDENRYAENFHKLFAENNEELKEKFQKSVSRRNSLNSNSSSFINEVLARMRAFFRR